VLAEPVLSAVGFLRRPSLRGARPYVLAAAGLLALDVVLKATLAPHWGAHLRGLVAR
jgi:hypothetical protein